MTDTVQIIGAPMDYGADRRGVDMGPSAIRYANLADGLLAARRKAAMALEQPSAVESIPTKRAEP